MCNDCIHSAMVTTIEMDLYKKKTIEMVVSFLIIFNSKSFWKKKLKEERHCCTIWKGGWVKPQNILCKF